MDGMVDCMNMIDEDPNSWTRECGWGTEAIYSFSGNSSEDCSMITQLKCPKSDSTINLDRVCTGKYYNCDSQVCFAAVPLLYCLQGLYSLESLAGKCAHVRLTHQKRVQGIEDSYVITSQKYAKSYICLESIWCMFRVPDTVINRTRVPSNL